jgi:WASH complex subunit FAM21
MASELLSNNADKWNLSCDIKLLDYLQKFSLDLSVKTKDLVNKVEDLGSDVSEADVRLRNTFNEFLMLANSQFIENVSTYIFIFN